MTYTDFIKSQIITEGIYNLHNAHSKLIDPAEALVTAYVFNTLPQHKNHELQVQFMWEENGIVISYNYEAGGFGSLDGPEKRSEIFRLTYKEVFGWELHPEKFISATWAREYLKNLTDNMFGGTRNNYEI